MATDKPAAASVSQAGGASQALGVEGGGSVAAKRLAGRQQPACVCGVAAWAGAN